MTWEIYIYAVGPLCQIRETAASENIRQRCSALPQYIATLREVPGTLCNPGQPGTLVWVPDENTPDTVYYQVIHVACQLFQKKSRQYCYLREFQEVYWYRAVLYDIMITAISHHHFSITNQWTYSGKHGIKVKLSYKSHVISTTFRMKNWSEHVLFMQCATHLNLGWRIIVLNRGDPIPTTAPLSTGSLFTDAPTTDPQLTRTPPSISSRKIGSVKHNHVYVCLTTVYVDKLYEDKSNLLCFV